MTTFCRATGPGFSSAPDLQIKYETRFVSHLGSHTEIVVTTSIEENNRFAMRKSDVYYVPASEAGLFMRRVAESSLCPPERVAVTERGAVTAQRADAMDDAEARRQFIIREMRRINPEWRPPRPLPQSYAYP